MVAMRYGCVPVVHAVGGLADTVSDYQPETGQGNGFSFGHYDAMALYASLVRAVETYRHAEIWRQLVRRCMLADFSWRRSAEKYIDLYFRALAVKRQAQRTLSDYALASNRLTVVSTERLYIQDPYLREFSAHVVGRQTVGGKPAVALDRTAFYPTGGGQPNDRGTLDGVPVVDVVVEDGVVWHLLDAELPGDEVRGAPRLVAPVRPHAAAHGPAYPFPGIRRDV